MLIERSNLRAQVLSASPEEIAFLHRRLVFTNPDAFDGDRIVRMYDPDTRSFPPGLLPAVQTQALGAGVRIEVLDRRIDPLAGRPWVLPNYLYPYQRAAVQAALQAKTGILWISTGGGKSVVLSGLVEAVPLPTVLLTHRSSLLGQLAASYEQFTGRKAGTVGEGRWEVRERFTVAMVQSLHSKLHREDVRRWLASIRMVLVDESHMAASPTVLTLLRYFPNAYYRIGVSATPLARGDAGSVRVVGALGPVCFRMYTRDLITEGYLAEPEVEFWRVQHHWTKEDTSERGYQEMYKACVVYSEDRNEAVVRGIISGDAPGWTFVNDLEHGRVLLGMCASMGYPARFISGEESTDNRRRHVEAQTRGEFRELIVTKMFQEGVDMKCLRRVSIAQAGKSAIGELQMVGRGSRKVAGKDTFQVREILDEGVPSLHRQALTRIQALQAESYQVRVVTPQRGN